MRIDSSPEGCPKADSPILRKGNAMNVKNLSLALVFALCVPGLAPAQVTVDSIDFYPHGISRDGKIVVVLR